MTRDPNRPFPNLPSPLARYLIGGLVGAFIVAGVCFMCSSPADARDWYVKAEAGTTLNAQVDTPFGTIELSDEPTYGVHLGTSVGLVRLEAGVRHVSGSINLGPISIESSAVNYTTTAYLDHSSGFYAGAGLDYYVTETDIGPFASFDDEGFGYHVSGGYATRINPRTILEFQGRYSDADLDTAGDLTGFAATVGVRYRPGGYAG